MKKLLLIIFCALFSLTCSQENPSEKTEASVSFFSFGDWGSGSQDQLQVATTLKSFCQSEVCDFGLLLGDNFYDAGVSSVQDPQWQTKFEQVYSGLQVPFYAVLGNHDHAGNAQAEIDYTQTQDRWKMPSPNYNIAFPENSSTPLLEIFALDSGPDDGKMPSPETLNNLATQLNASQAQWKILAMHHPLYSNGPHGDTKALQGLIPLICNQVDVVLSGHDHVFSHLDDTKDPCTFHQWVIGTGGKELYSPLVDPRSLFSEANFGFAAIKATKKAIEVRFIRKDGTIANDYVLTK